MGYRSSNSIFCLSLDQPSYTTASARHSFTGCSSPREETANIARTTRCSPKWLVVSFQDTLAILVGEMITSSAIDASPAAFFQGYSKGVNVSVDIVAIGQPFDATVARVVLSVDHRRSHNNNQQQGSDWNQFHFLKRLADWFFKKV